MAVHMVLRTVRVVDIDESRTLLILLPLCLFGMSFAYKLRTVHIRIGYFCVTKHDHLSRDVLNDCLKPTIYKDIQLEPLGPQNVPPSHTNDK